MRRVISLVPVMLVVAAVVFLLVHITPGDPVSVILGPDASPRDVERVRGMLELDQPLLVQLGRWFLRLTRGDLGQSLFLDRPVSRAVIERLEPTGLLTVFSALLAVLIGVPAGVVAAARHNSLLDYGFMLAALLGVSIPNFWLGLGLILLFSVELRWLPAAGYQPVAEGLAGALRYLVMPAVALGFTQSALIARITRASMLEVLRQDFIRTARAKGLSERVVTYKHALRNALIPTLTVIGITVAVLMGGAIVVETVFNLPGLGRLIIQSVLRRDYPVIQGAVLFVATVYVVINLIVDVLYVWVDPRIHYS